MTQSEQVCQYLSALCIGYQSRFISSVFVQVGSNKDVDKGYEKERENEISGKIEVLKDTYMKRKHLKRHQLRINDLESPKERYAIYGLRRILHNRLKIKTRDLKF